MALSIKNNELEAAAREVALLTGKPITEALLEGVKRELHRQKQIKVHAKRNTPIDRAMKIAARSAARPDVSSALSDDQVLGYDELFVQPEGTNREGLHEGDKKSGGAA